MLANACRRIEVPQREMGGCAKFFLQVFATLCTIFNFIHLCPASVVFSLCFFFFFSHPLQSSSIFGATTIHGHAKENGVGCRRRHYQGIFRLAAYLQLRQWVWQSSVRQTFVARLLTLNWKNLEQHLGCIMSKRQMIHFYFCDELDQVSITSFFYRRKDNIKLFAWHLGNQHHLICCLWDFY